MKRFFRDWNYKKHAKVVTCAYLAMYAIDMTIGYILVKKCISGLDEEKKDEVEYVG